VPFEVRKWNINSVINFIMGNFISFEESKKYKNIKKEDVKIGVTVCCVHSAMDDGYHVEKIISIDSEYHFSTRIKGKREHHYADCKLYCL